MFKMESVSKSLLEMVILVLVKKPELHMVIKDLWSDMTQVFRGVNAHMYRNIVDMSGQSEPVISSLSVSVLQWDYTTVFLCL